MFFQKGELVHSFKHMTALRVDLADAIDKRDALASDVTTLTAQIAAITPGPQPVDCYASDFQHCPRRGSIATLVLFCYPKVEGGGKR